TVVVKEEGYIGTIKLSISYSADGKTVLGYQVLESEETPGIGSKVDEEAYKTLLAGTTLPIYANGMDISAILATAENNNGNSDNNDVVAVPTELKDGVYKAIGEPASNGYVPYVTMTVEGGKITAVTWDEEKNGEWKSELSTTGKYVMKPVWNTQAESMCAYVVEHQGTAGLNLTEAGKTDVVSGVSISVANFTGLIEQAIAEANGKDGTYKVEATPDEKGNYAFVSITIEGGKIVAATWDEMYNGELKSVLSTTGKYVMKPVWDTQAKSMCQYVVDNQGTAGLNLSEAGKTDVVSGVSISVNGFTGLVEECIAKASGLYKDGVYTAEATPDEKGNYAFVSVTIENGKIVAVTWDEAYNGSLKSVLSTTGQYVMKPVWDTQAKKMCQYVVDNQGTAGLNLSEAGKTDVVSGVSINVSGFTGLIEQAIAEANGKDGTYKAEAVPDEKGNYAFVSITVEGGKIVAATWDEMYNGELKSVLSTTGKYVMKPVWQTQSERMCQYVVDNQTTAGLNLNEAGKTDVVSGVSINVSGFTSLVDECLRKAKGGYTDGVYEVVGEPASNGYVAHVIVTIEGGKIASVVWDEEKDGEWKSVLSTTGKYVMKPVWNTQAESMCAYVVEHQGTAGLNLNEAGKTDVVSGVSISVANFTTLIEQAIADANGKDGTFKAEAAPDEKGNYAFVSITVEGGKIVAATWDEVYNGSLKSELSTTGKYVMKPVWDTQAKAMAAYVVENQTTAGLNLNESGKTDVVSGVSISVNGFVDLVNKALTQASATGEIVEPEQPQGETSQGETAQVEATLVDVVSGATYSSRAVIRAINEGYVFLRDNIVK
ncbi:MAG: FMN-binding protein, partial [Lachnospiraceae bacterium]